MQRSCTVLKGLRRIPAGSRTVNSGARKPVCEIPWCRDSGGKGAKTGLGFDLLGWKKSRDKPGAPDDVRTVETPDRPSESSTTLKRLSTVTPLSPNHLRREPRHRGPQARLVMV